MIPHARPDIGPAEEAAVLETLRSGQIAAGPAVRRLQAALSAHLGVRHVLATSSGTAALHLALLGLRVGPGHRVVVPTYACASLLHVVDYVGAEPVLVDAAPGGFNIDLDAVRERYDSRVRAIIVPHMFGRPVDVSALPGPVVEDCAQALGATAGGRPVGARGAVAVFSFYATKMAAAGEGGALATRSVRVHRIADDLHAYDERARYRRRFAYRMTDVEAALAGVQLARLGHLVARRHAIDAMYRQALGKRVDLVPLPPGAVPYRFLVRLPRGRLTTVIERMQREGVSARRPVFRPLHRMLGLPPREFRHAEDAWARLLSLPLYVGLTEADVARVVAVLGRALA